MTTGAPRVQPVNPSRSLWLEPHFLAAHGGRRARAAAAALGDEAHGVILEAADRLAAVSARVAQRFYLHAAPMFAALGGDGFRHWFELGHALLLDAPAQRDAAAAYFGLAPKLAIELGLERLAAWCALGREAARLSRRLAVTFFEATAPRLGKVSAAHLAQWARVGMDLHGRSGWRGEFLAQAYMGSAGAALPILGADELGPWAELGVALQPAVKEQAFFNRLPEGFGSLHGEERRLLLDTCVRAAAGNVAAAAGLYQRLPSALRRLRPAVRLGLLEVFRHATAAGSEALPGLATLAPVAGALVRALPAAARPAALAHGIDVARAFPAAAAAFLRSLPRVYEEADREAVSGWVRRGLEIAADNDEAGLAYFALQSRTSLKVLQASSTAAALAEAQNMLRQFVQMLSGRPASIRGTEGAALRPPLEEFPLENEVALPLRVDAFATHEDNLRVYRFLAAQLAGRRDFGTYEVAVPPADDGGSRGLLAFLEAPEQPPLLAEIFLVAEGFRVAAALARAYPGLAVEQRSLARRLLARERSERLLSQSNLCDTLYVWLLAGLPAGGLAPWLRPLADLVAACVAPLASRGASANDALAVALELTRRLLARAEGERDGPASGLILEKDVPETTLLDQFIYDYDAGPDLPPAAEQAPGGDDAQPPAEVPAPADELRLEEREEDGEEGGTPLSPEALQKLIESGADLRLQQGYGENVDGLGLYITDLVGKVPEETLQELRSLLQEAPAEQRPAGRRWQQGIDRRGAGATFFYDEWDHQIQDYRQRWCRLREIAVEGDSGEFFQRALADYAALLPEVRRQFQRIRPETYRIVRGLEDGEDFDLNAVVDARVDRRVRRAPSPKLYVARAREERDVATLFLIDMSASTDEPLRPAPPAPAAENDDPVLPLRDVGHRVAPARRIIDVTKEALVVMAEALEEIGDAYAIYGFSGHGRQNVEFYLVKNFGERLSGAVKGRIGALEPKRSTRMGTALRHAVEKMAGVASRARHIILLSDGFPQDFDYGQDRRSNVYGLRDTTVALRECEAAGITPFCITVDKAGHDYLREMCDSARYMVIDDIAALPRELPKIYQRVVTT